MEQHKISTGTCKDDTNVGSRGDAAYGKVYEGTEV